MIKLFKLCIIVLVTNTLAYFVPQSVTKTSFLKLFCSNDWTYFVGLFFLWGGGGGRGSHISLKNTPCHVPNSQKKQSRSSKFCDNEVDSLSSVKMLMLSLQRVHSNKHCWCQWTMNQVHENSPRTTGAGRKKGSKEKNGKFKVSINYEFSQ